MYDKLFTNKMLHYIIIIYIMYAGYGYKMHNMYTLKLIEKKRVKCVT